MEHSCSSLTMLSKEDEEQKQQQGCRGGAADWLCQCLALSKSIKIVYNVPFWLVRGGNKLHCVQLQPTFLCCHTRHGDGNMAMSVLMMHAHCARFLHKKPEVSTLLAAMSFLWARTLSKTTAITRPALSLSPSLSPISLCVFYVPRKCERFFQDSFGAATRVFNKQHGELAAWLEFPVTKTRI